MTIEEKFNMLLPELNKSEILSNIIKHENKYYLAYWEKHKWNLSSEIKLIDTDKSIITCKKCNSFIFDEFGKCAQCGEWA